MEQHGSFPGTGQAAAGSLSVYAAESGGGVSGGAVAEIAGSGGSGFRNGLTGVLALQGVDSLTEEETGAVLTRLDSLMRWAQAQQAKALSRMQRIYRDDIEFATGKLEPGMAFSLAAEEAAALLHLPSGTASRLMSEAGTLSDALPATLQELEAGTISYRQAQTVVDQAQGIPAEELPAFEGYLLAGAAELTAAQFQVRARRARESRYPETVAVRHRSALEDRRVCLQPDVDGMSWFSAFLPAPTAQAIYTQLCVAARGEQAAGDPRGVDQLRADILAELLLNNGGSAEDTDPDHDDDGGGNSGGRGTGFRNRGRGQQPARTARGRGSARARARVRAKTEILVLINADTLFGADEQPAELHGYGPISPETARRMAREAAHWTPVERDAGTGQILRIGRKRKPPDHVRRWLRARDGTCRFPGCRTNAVLSEIDHTKPWAQGGLTDHDNLEYLCRRHHMFKTAGFWKACQPSPGIIEWTSPGGRRYRTEPHLTLALPEAEAEAPPFPPTHVPAPVQEPAPPTRFPASQAGSGSPPELPEPGAPPEDFDDDYGGNPPPF